jgi:[ribosomal protein S18]-alanine N-acetyltransferase
MPKRMKIRRARPGDLPRILEIERATFGIDAYDRKLFAEYLHICGDLFLVALRGPSICGYLIACLGGRAGSAELVSIAVDPAARQQGAASALLDSTLRRLRRRNATGLTLMVREANEPALAFYRKNGFRRIRRVEGYYEDGAAGLRMRKELMEG